MASGLTFFSSPPHPTSNPWSRETATPFFTPQQSSRKNNWGAPNSPSPLRTSKNANLMAGMGMGGDGFEKQWNDTTDENKHQNEAGSICQNTSTGYSSNHAHDEENTPMTSTSFSNFTTPSLTTSTSSTTTPSFSFGTPATPLFTQNSVMAQDRATQFQFSARARSSSPAALLQSHTRESRDERKRLFLDRLRSKRDDVRSDRTGDQVLRMDFMRERRRWVEKKEMEKGIWGVVNLDDMVDVDVDVDADVDVSAGENWENEEMSPVEDGEVDELALQYYSQQQQRQGDMNEVNEFGSVSDDVHVEEFSDDGYDEAFMEFLSQDSGPVTNHQGYAAGVDGGATTAPYRLDAGVGGANVDSEMDMS